MMKVPETLEALLLAQIRDAHENYEGFGKTGEFVLAKREDDQMVFLLNHRHSEQGSPQVIPFNSNLAEPMRRSLSGESGTIIGLDYRGETVLAAYEPVRELGWGIVAKIDLAEVQWPFIRAGMIAVGVGILMVSLGAYLFYRVTNPLLSELEESEIRFRSTFEQAAVGLAHVDTDGHFLRLNQRFCDIVGYSPEELLHMTFLEITHPDDLSVDVKLARQLFAGEIQTYSIEKRCIHKNGFVVWINLTGSLKRTLQGKVEYAIAVVEDISERRIAEMALMESEERFRGIFEQAAVGVGMLSEEGRFLKVNQRYCEITGYSAEEMQNMTFYEITYPDDLEENLVQSKRLLDGEGDQFTLEKRFVRKSGEIVWITLAVTLVKSELEQRQYFISIVEDITERKQAADALRISEARYAHLAENIPGTIYQYLQRGDVQTGEMLFLSPQIKALYGIAPEDLMRDRDRIWSAIYPEDLEDFLNSVRQAGTAVEAWFHEWRILLPSGVIKWVQGIAHPERQEDGSLLWDGILLDITEQKQAEAIIKDQENRFRLLVESSPLPMLVFNQDRETVYLNRQFEKAFGYTLQDVPNNESWWLLAYPDENYRGELREFWSQVTRIAMTGSTETYSKEVLIACKDGPQKTVLVNASSIGEYMLVIYTDLTERKAMEESLRNSEERYRALVENTPDLIYTLDANGRYIAVNQALCKTIGLSEAEIIGKNAYELGLPSEIAQDWFARYHQVLTTGAPLQFETVIPFSDDNVLTYEVALVPIYDSAGKVAGIRGVSRDVTGKRNAEAQIERQLERISALHNIDLAISSSLDLDFTLDVILNQVINQLQVDASDVFLYDPLMQNLNCAARRGFWTALKRDLHRSGWEAAWQERLHWNGKPCVWWTCLWKNQEI